MGIELLDEGSRSGLIDEGRFEDDRNELRDNCQQKIHQIDWIKVLEDYCFGFIGDEDMTDVFFLFVHSLSYRSINQSTLLRFVRSFTLTDFPFLFISLVEKERDRTDRQTKTNNDRKRALLSIIINIIG